MADWAMFGAEASPVRLAEEDSVNQMSKIAQANYTNTLATKQMQEIEKSKKIAAAFANQPVEQIGKPTSPADKLLKDAEVYRGLGEHEKAGNLMRDAAAMMSSISAERSHSAQASLNQAKLVDSQANQAAEFIDDNIKSQADLDTANDMIEQVTGRPSPYRGKGMAYSPELIQRLKRSGLSAKQRATLDYDIQKIESGIEANDSLIKLRQARAIVAAADVRLRDARALKLDKEGGDKTKPETFPTNPEIESAAVEIRGRYPNLQSSDLPRFSFAVASEAKAMMNANKGLTAEAAVQRAIESRKDDLTSIEVSEKVLGVEKPWTRKTERTYQPKPAGAATPPADTGVASRSTKFLPGGTYTFPTKSGPRVGTWMGKDAQGRNIIEWEK
jgi:hypothetical protein